MSIATDTDMDSLRHAEAWPPGAVAFDSAGAGFLYPSDLARLAGGADRASRHRLVYRPVVEVVPGMVFEGYNALSAPPKIGKTRLAHQLMLAVSQGRDWLGREVAQGEVLFVAMEDTLASVVEREKTFYPDKDGLSRFVAEGHELWVATDPGASPGERFAWLSSTLESRRGLPGREIKLVVLDTAAKFLGMGDVRRNAYEQGLELYAPIDRLGLEHHCAILGVHHDRKGGEGGDDDPLMAVSGGVSITGVAQSVISIRRTRGSTRGRMLVVPRNAPEHEFGLEFVGGEWSASAEPAEAAAERDGCSRHLLGLLAHGDWVGTRALRALSDSWSVETVSRTLQRLRERQRVEVSQVEVGMDGEQIWAWRSLVATPEPDRALPACDRCGVRPARIAPKSGDRWCAGCAPWLFPVDESEEVVDGVDAVDRADGDGVGVPGDVASLAALYADALAEQPGEPEEEDGVPAEHDPVVSEVVEDGGPAAPGDHDDVEGDPESGAEVEESGAHGGDGSAFRRPAWAPKSFNRKDTHPITVFNELLEESFRLKRVQLVAHPYPRDEDVPEPFRKPGPGRQMDVHEGGHNWRTNKVPLRWDVRGQIPCEAHVMDRNGGFLGVWGSAELPIGRLREHAGRGPSTEVGAHHLDRFPEWFMENFPHPGGSCRARGAVWVTTPTLQVMEQAARVFPGMLGEFHVMKSLTCKKLKLDRLQKTLRDARLDAFAQGDIEFADFIKAVYSLGTSTLGESGANRRIWRPDWAAMIRATFHANHWRSARRAMDHGLGVVGLRKTDELHVLGDPFQTCMHDAQIDVRNPTLTCFTEGIGLDEWKSKGVTEWEIHGDA